MTLFKKRCVVCSTWAIRKKKSEAKRTSWKFCSKHCQSIFLNRKRWLSQKEQICLNCKNTFYGRTRRQLNRKYCSVKCGLIYRNKFEIPNLPHYEEIRKKLSEGARKRFKGIKKSKEFRKQMSERYRGKKSHFWKGGISSENQKFKESLEYKLWVEAIFKRDKYTCVWCKDNRGGNLDADHIKPFCMYPELRLAINNGQTLCRSCHIWKTRMDQKLYQWHKLKTIALDL